MWSADVQIDLFDFNSNTELIFTPSSFVKGTLWLYSVKPVVALGPPRC